MSSDDETLFITQANPVNTSLNVSGQESDFNPMEDSLIDFALATDALLTLDSPGETAGTDVNRLYGADSPPLRNSASTPIISLNDVNTEDEPAIEENPVDNVNGNVPEMAENVPPVPVGESLQDVAERFPDVSDADLEKLQHASKSERTHKQTLWGVKILTGNIFSLNIDILLLLV